MKLRIQYVGCLYSPLETYAETTDNETCVAAIEDVSRPVVALVGDRVVSDRATR
jgi:hypothetical protein